jgi:hypothetical protein
MSWQEVSWYARSTMLPPPGTQQLDSQMHKMMHEKHKRQARIKEDAVQIARIDETIASHIDPNLVRA